MGAWILANIKQCMVIWLRKEINLKTEFIEFGQSMAINKQKNNLLNGKKAFGSGTESSMNILGHN